MLQRTLPAGFIAPCLPTKTDKLPCSQWLHEIKHDGFPDVGSKKRSVFRNLLSQPARSASNPGELHASFLPQTCARCNGFARNRRAVTSHRARAVTYCQGARNKPDFQGSDRKRTFRQKMDGRAADGQ